MSKETGRTGGVRTRDPNIKSVVLYQLSYSPSEVRGIISNNLAVVAEDLFALLRQDKTPSSARLYNPGHLEANPKSKDAGRKCAFCVFRGISWLKYAIIVALYRGIC